MKKLLSIILALTLLCGTVAIAPFGAVTVDEAYTAEAEAQVPQSTEDISIVYFGGYFQDKVTDPAELQIVTKADFGDDNIASVNGIRYLRRNRDYFRDKPIAWRVIGQEDGGYLLMSENVIASRRFAELKGLSEKQFWSNSELRTWLNSDFLNTAFSDEDKTNLVLSHITNIESDYDYRPGGGKPYIAETDDYVYLLSKDEMEALYDQSDRIAYATEYVDSQKGAIRYWLRGPKFWNYGNPGGYYVNPDGTIGWWYITYTYGIRPVIKVKSIEGLDDSPYQDIPTEVSIETQAPTTKPVETQAPTTKATETEAAVWDEGGYYFTGPSYDWNVTEIQKLSKADNDEYDEYHFTCYLSDGFTFKIVHSSDGETIDAWYPDGIGNAYGENGEITEDGSYDIYFRPDMAGDESWFCGCIYVDGMPAPTEGPPTEELPTEVGYPTEEPPTEEPPVEDGGYYLTGSYFGWEISNSYKLERTDNTEYEEYVINYFIITSEEIKIVHSSDGETIDAWYPDGIGNAYGENGEITEDGSYDIYFRPDMAGDDSWFCGCIYADGMPAPTEPETIAPVTEAPIPVVSAKEIVITADKTTAAPGDEIAFTVTIGPVTDMAYITTHVVIPEGLTIDESSISFDMNAFNAKYGFIFSGVVLDGTTIINDGAGPANKTTTDSFDVYTFRCTVDDDAAGTLTVGFNDAEFVLGNEDGNNLTDEYTCTGVDITVAGETQSVEDTDGYYVVGNMSSWAPDKAYKMSAAEDGKYVLNDLDITATTEFKVVKVEGENQTWYPNGMGNNYGQNSEITAEGTYDVYFDPALASDGWFYNCIYVDGMPAPTEESPTQTPTQETQAIVTVSDSYSSETKIFNVGDTFTVYTTLNTGNIDSGKISSVFGVQSYTDSVLSVNEDIDDELIADKNKVFPVMKDDVSCNCSVAGKLYYSGSTSSFFLFNSDKSILLAVSYKVTGPGVAKVTTSLELLGMADKNVTCIIKDGVVYNPDFTMKTSFKNPEEPVYIGDANGDGDVDAIDSTIVQRVATMVKVPYDRDQMMNADVDGDGELTVLDATYILRYSSHVKTPYPVGELR